MYHLNPNGELKVCNAKTRPCKYMQITGLTIEEANTNLLAISPESKAQFLIDEANKREEKITEDLQSFTKKLEGKLVGLKYRIKTKDSLAKKISNKDEVVQMRDVLRYTYQSSANNLVSDANKMIKEMKKQGYSVTKCKNTWTTKLNPYKGVNMCFSKNGYEFELQLHTPESFSLKDGEMHLLYEKQRVLKQGTDEWYSIQDKMLEMSNNLERPKNIDKLTLERIG